MASKYFVTFVFFHVFFLLVCLIFLEIESSRMMTESFKLSWALGYGEDSRQYVSEAQCTAYYNSL